MAELHPSIKEFIKDENMEYSKARILSTLAQLEREGKPPRSLLRALLMALVVYSGQRPLHEDYSFLRRCRDHFDNLVTGMDAILDDEIEKNKKLESKSS